MNNTTKAGTDNKKEARRAWGGDTYFISDGLPTEYFINLQKQKVENEQKNRITPQNQTQKVPMTKQNPIIFPGQNKRNIMPNSIADIYLKGDKKVNKDNSKQNKPKINKKQYCTNNSIKRTQTIRMPGQPVKQTVIKHKNDKRYRNKQNNKIYNAKGL